MDKFSKLIEDHLQLKGVVGPEEEDKSLMEYVARMVPILEETDRAHKEDLTQTTFLAKNLLHRVKTAFDEDLPAQFGELWSKIDSENKTAKEFQSRVDGSFKQLGHEFE